MRHSIANLFYAIGRAIDRPAVRCEGGKRHFGDERTGESWNSGATSWTMNIHTRDTTLISGDFHPPEYGLVYAALHIADVTVFLTWRSSIALLHVLRGFDESFATHGEGRRR